MFLLIFYLIYICILAFLNLRDLTLISYYLGFFYNIIYAEEIANLLFNYYFSFLICIFHSFNIDILVPSNFKISSFFTVPKLQLDFVLPSFDVHQIIFLIFSTYIYIRFFFRSLAFFGASVRREDWFIYQEWFKVAKNLTPRQMQVKYRLLALSNDEFNNLLKRMSIDLIYHDDGYNEETGYYEDVEADESDFSHHYNFKDVYKALYYYFLNKNEERLAKNAASMKNTLYYKDRYGADIFSYLNSKEDDKMANFSSVKTFRDVSKNA